MEPREKLSCGRKAMPRACIAVISLYQQTKQSALDLPDPRYFYEQTAREP